MIAITGAAGFIGSNLAHRLAGLGHELLLVDNPLTSDKTSNLNGLERFRFVPHDVFLEQLAHESQALQAVFHLGACSSTTETNWNFLRSNNIEYSQRLWEWCARSSCPFIYASSAATYGDGSQGFDDRTHPSELRPLNAYGRSKNDFDYWALQQREQARPSPPAWAGLKFFNVYGPREGHKGSMASMVWRAYHQIKENKAVRLFRSNDPDYADGEQKRDFVYVEDCIDHMLWFWQGNREPGIYNSGTGIPRTFLDLVRSVFACLAQEPEIQFIDMPGELALQYQNFTCARMDKLYGAGFPKAPTTLEEGVAGTLRVIKARGLNAEILKSLVDEE